MSIEGIDEEDWNGEIVEKNGPSLEEQRRAALADAGKALGVVSSMLAKEAPEVPDVVAQEEQLRKSNDRRLKEMIAMYGQAPDPSTWNNARMAHLFDTAWGAEGTLERAAVELELQKKFEQIISKAEAHLRQMKLLQGTPMRPQGPAGPNGLIIP